MANRPTLEEIRAARPASAARKSVTADEDRKLVFDAFRRWGYLEANLDPLGLFQPLKHPDLEGLHGENAEEARRTYCGTVGADFMYLPDRKSTRLNSSHMSISYAVFCLKKKKKKNK